MFSSTFMDLVKLCIPSKNVLVRPRDKPWYDSEIRKTSRQRDRQKQKAIKSQTVNNWTLYKRLRNKVNNLKKHAKERFYNNIEFIISDANVNDQRKYWKLLKYFIKTNSTCDNIPPLQSTSANGATDFCITDYDKATCLNDFIVSISSVDDANTPLPNFNFKTNSRLTNIQIIESEIFDILKILNIIKASCDDGISHRIKRNCSHNI